MADTTPHKTYRPMPRDFAETYERVGWDGICEAYRAHKLTVRRWIIDCGEEELQQRRRRWLEARYAERGHRVPGVRPGRRLRPA